MTISFLNILTDRARNQPDDKAYIFLQDGETESDSLTYGELDKRAKAIAYNLQSYKGERALLLYPCGLEFISTFFGCLYAGIVAIPVYPPRGNQKLSRLLSIVQDAQAKLVLTTSSISLDIEQRWKQEADLGQLKLISTDTIDANQKEFVLKSVVSESLAFLQYTSGSTGTPKGVMITHGNIIHNQQIIQTAFRHSEKSIVVSWLPLFHDMGLIGHVLQPMYMGCPSILIPPVAFLQRPICWLRAISKYRATTSGGPNFAYDLCVEKIPSEQLANLDLSSWDLAFNGAEPIRAKTLEQFANKFVPCGFNYSAFYPCYGMAESTLLSTGGNKNNPPVIKKVKKEGLEQNFIVEDELSSSKSHLLVGCGHSYLDSKVIIVNLETLTCCDEKQVGEIWLSGESIASGYWNRPEQTQHTFKAYLKNNKKKAFLRTGDLGYISNGELFVTGRLKDMIIIRGRNHYPQDIELSIENSHPALQTNSGAAFSIEVEGEEKLVVVQEVRRSHLRQLNRNAVLKAINKAVSLEHELAIETIVLLKPGTIDKTSSGKIQRHSCRQKFLDQNLTGVIVSKSLLEFEREYVPPRNTVEQILVEIWQELLGVQKVGIHDNFFELGGDSVLAIQVVNKAKQQDRVLILEQIFQHQTIAELASVVNTTKIVKAQQNLVKGIAPLLPAQKNMFDIIEVSELNLSCLNGKLYDTRKSLDPELLKKAILELFVHHDALRMRFIKTDRGWQQINAEIEDSTIFEQFNLSSLSVERQKQKIIDIANKIRHTINISTGPLAKVIFFKLRENQNDKVLFIFHHLITDAISMQILWEDIATIYRQISSGKLIKLPSKSTSVKFWAKRLTEYAHSENIQKERAYWLEIYRKYDYRLPIDNFTDENDKFDIWTNPIMTSLNSEETQILLNEITALYHTGITDLLIAALVQTFMHWSGKSYLLLRLLSHGRYSIFEDIDLSRTVGWLAMDFPILLNIEGTQSTKDALKKAKEQLAQIPNHGIGYSALRYMSQDKSFVKQLKSFIGPEVYFNFQGQYTDSFSDDILFTPSKQVINVSNYNPPKKEKRLIKVRALIVNSNLEIYWHSSGIYNKQSTIERLSHKYIKTLQKYICSVNN